MGSMATHTTTASSRCSKKSKLDSAANPRLPLSTGARADPQTRSVVFDLRVVREHGTGIGLMERELGMTVRRELLDTDD